MNWKKNKYTVIKKAIDPSMAEYLKNYILLKRRVLQTFMTTQYLSEFNTDWGTWQDPQVPGTYSHYGDIAMETLLTALKPKMEKVTGTKLYENYSYTRIYKVKDELRRHKDRFSCEISTTLNLGGDNWPIFIDPTGSNNVIDEYKNIHKPGAPKGVKVDLKPGDMLIYSGCELEHWREPFEGDLCGQVFLHYNHADGRFAKSNLYDKRPMLGIVKTR